MENTSPTNGNHVTNASRLPQRETTSRCFSNFSGLMLNHFSMRSILPSHPMAYDVNPPIQFPTVAKTKHRNISNPATSEPINNASALNGTTVDAKNEPINSPQYPNCSNISQQKNGNKWRSRLCKDIKRFCKIHISYNSF